MTKTEFNEYIDNEYFDNKYSSIVDQFTKKSTLPPIVTLGLIMSLFYVLHIVICLICGEYEQLANDWATPMGVIGGFYLFVVYLYLEKKVKNYYIIIGQLTQLEKETFRNFYEHFIISAFRSRNLVLFCLILILITNITVLKMGLWYDSLLANFWLLVEMNIVIIGGVLNLWLMICTSRMLCGIGKKPIQINLFHHDGMGGLNVFGELSFSFFALATIFATLLAVILFFAPWKNAINYYYGPLLLITVYSIVMISFFIPLLSLHKTVKNFKEKQLCLINGILLTYNNETLKNPSDNLYPVDIKDKIEKPLFFQDNILKMKTWPFGYNTIVKVLSGTLIPLVSMLFNI